MKTFVIELEIVETYELYVDAESIFDASLIVADMEDPTEEGTRVDASRRIVLVEEA
jgi:hypothetical protein